MKWLGYVWAAGMVSGCLIPQDDTLLQELPLRRNRPPRIVESQVQPPDRIIRDFGDGDLCELNFSVIVEDPDVDDLITVSWYLDYDAQNPVGYYRMDRLTNTGQPQRGDRATLSINLRAANSPLRTPGDHLVEALVSDSRLTGREPESETIVLPDGGTLIDPGYAVTYSWFVTTVQGDCQ